VAEMWWKPTNVDLQDWLEAHIYLFTCQESAYLDEEIAIFKDKYLFECLHEILWDEFQVNLYKLLESLVE